MCGRYQLDEDMNEIIERYDINSIFQDTDAKIGEIFPTNKVPVIMNFEGKKTLKIVKWGIRPSFMNKDVINTRMESLFVKKMFDKGIINGRCMIPFNWFFEWEKVESSKIKRKIFVPDQKIMSFAGILIDGFSIITKAAEGDISDIHSRMPVILDINDENKWIKEGLSREEINQILDRSISDFKIA